MSVSETFLSRHVSVNERKVFHITIFKHSGDNHTALWFVVSRCAVTPAVLIGSAAPLGSARFEQQQQPAIIAGQYSSQSKSVPTKTVKQSQDQPG